MLHYKEGLLEDYEGNRVYFNGSANFTGNGMLGNAESLKISRSWYDGQDEIEYEEQFM